MTKLGKAYARAVYALALREGIVEEVFEQLTALRAGMADQPAFPRLLSEPSIGKEERIEILETSFSGKLHPYVLNLLKLLTKNSHIGCFGDCCDDFARQYYTDRGILTVYVESATALTPKQIRRLQEKLEMKTGKSVRISCRIDPLCIGGVRLTYNGVRVDGTVRHHLEKLASALKNAVV